MAVDTARAKSLFLAASDLADPAERAAYLERECGGDAELRGRVEALLRANDAAPLPPPGAGEATGAHVPNRLLETVDRSDPAARVGSVIAGRYKLLEEIGAGGMGAVWVAEQTQPVRRKVALKLIKAGMDSKSVLARFEAERQALAVMDHPNIAKVLDGGLTSGEPGGVSPGRPFFVMEYVKGVPITEYCDATRLSVPERLHLFVQVCQAVQHAHQKGIIHRDLKPSNILVAPYDDKPVPKVIDFGLAKAMHQSLTERTLHTAHETVLGTPIYMSPEQAQLNNLDVDTRSDIYSLGVLLYELLTGTTPLEKQRFKEAGWDEVRRIIREEEPPRPSTRLSSTHTLPSLAAGRQTEPARLTKLVRGELDWIVMKALEKDRSRRYETANGFAMDVQRFLAGEPVLAVPPSTGYRLRKFVRRHKGRVIAATAVAVALVVGVAAVVAVQVRANRDLADKNAELAAEQTKVEARNKELAEEQAKVQARFDTAVKAIETFHTGVSEDALLKNPEFKELRTKLLKEAAGFYADLEKLLAGQTDAKSRKTLAKGYFQLADLTAKIGDATQALAVHRKALAVRRELAAAPGADVETRLDVARSLESVGGLVLGIGDVATARKLLEEQRDLAERMEAHDPTEDGKVLLAHAHDLISGVLWGEGKLSEALESRAKGLALYRKLADANPANGRFRQWQAGTYAVTAMMLTQMGKAAEGLESLHKALEIMQALVDGDNANAEYQEYLAMVHNNIGIALMELGRRAEALEAYGKALAVWRKQVDANPAVTSYQANLVYALNNIGVTLHRAGNPAEALVPLREAIAMQQKLADANPAVIDYHQTLAWIQHRIGEALLVTGKPAEALQAYRCGFALYQKVARPNFQWGVGWSQNLIGEATLVTGNSAEALEWFRKSLPVRQKMVKDNPGNVEYEIDLTVVHNNIGRAQARQMRFAEAFSAFDTGLSGCQKLAEADPKNNLYKVGIGMSHACRGGARVRAGQPAEAAADLRRALELWAKAPYLSVESQLERARTLALLAGLDTDAKSGVTTAEAAQFADQSVAALAAIVKTGWALPSELKEPDFDALRGRMDFQKLVVEVEARAEKPAEAPATKEDKK